MDRNRLNEGENMHRTEKGKVGKEKVRRREQERRPVIYFPVRVSNLKDI
jgi:hypothetical protein